MCSRRCHASERDLVEVVARAQRTGVDPQGVVLQLIVGHADPQVEDLRSWAIGVFGTAYEPPSAETCRKKMKVIKEGQQ